MHGISETPVLTHESLLDFTFSYREKESHRICKIVCICDESVQVSECTQSSTLSFGLKPQQNHSLFLKNVSSTRLQYRIQTGCKFEPYRKDGQRLNLFSTAHIYAIINLLQFKLSNLEQIPRHLALSWYTQLHGFTYRPDSAAPILRCISFPLIFPTYISLFILQVCNH